MQQPVTKHFSASKAPPPRGRLLKCLGTRASLRMLTSCFLVLSLLSGFSIDAQASEITVHAPEEALELGEPFVLSYTMELEPGTTISHTKLDRIHFGAIELLEDRETQEEIDGRLHYRLELSAVIYRVGVFYFPPIEFELAHPEGVEKLSAPQLGVEVRGAIFTGEEAAELWDEMEYSSLFVTDWRLLWGTLLLLALAGLGYLSWRWRRARARARSQEEQAPPLAPWEIALNELGTLDFAALSAAEQRQMVFKLSEVLRAYLGARYRFDALELTLSELKNALSCLRLPPGFEAQVLSQLFEDWDQVKFAKQQYPAAHLQSQLELGRAFVTATTPSPKESAAADPAHVEVAHG